jgi:hypothetical protein
MGWDGMDRVEEAAIKTGKLRCPNTIYLYAHRVGRVLDDGSA